MDFTYTFQAAVICLLVPVETTATRSLQSFLRQKEDCQAGNLLQIHFEGGTTQARLDGTSTDVSTSRFTIENARGKKCIQYTGKQGGDTQYYALKVIDNTRVTFMNEQCSSTTADAFLFDEERNNIYRYYKHTNLYLGVRNNCMDDGLSLICSKIGDRRCKFRWTS